VYPDAGTAIPWKFPAMGARVRQYVCVDVITIMLLSI